MKFKEVRPELIEFLIEPIKGELPSNSTAKIDVKCPVCKTINRKKINILSNSGLNEKNCDFCRSLENKRPDLIEYLVNEEDKKLPALSGKRIDVKCKVCNTVRSIIVADFNRSGFPCNTCKSLENKNPEVVKYLVNKEDGKLSFGSRSIIKVRCTICNHEKDISVQLLASKGISCSECALKTSVPERFMTQILKSLNLEFKKEYSSTWTNKKRYDFYIPSLNMIIETHGAQHYIETNRVDLIEIQENDILKEKLAKENGIENYISIDCRRSEKNFLSTNIKNSLMDYIDFSKIDFDTLWEKTMQTNLVSNICLDYQDSSLTISEIAEKNNTSVTSVVRYIKETSIEKRTKDPIKTYELFQKIKNKRKVGELLGIHPETVARHIKKVESMKQE